MFKTRLFVLLFFVCILSTSCSKTIKKTETDFEATKPLIGVYYSEDRSAQIEIFDGGLIQITGLDLTFDALTNVAYQEVDNGNMSEEEYIKYFHDKMGEKHRFTLNSFNKYTSLLGYISPMNGGQLTFYYDNAEERIEYNGYLFYLENKL